MYDMKLSTEEKKDFCSPNPINSAPKYPHGLKLRLGPEELKKLNFQKMPDIDTVFKLFSKVKVVEIESNEEGEHCLCLQIMEMDLKGTEEKEKEATKILYGES